MSTIAIIKALPAAMSVPGKFSDFANVSERCSHDNGFVVILLVILVDALHGLHTRVLHAAKASAVLHDRVPAVQH